MDARTRKAGFSTPTEYVRHLIRLDLERETQRRLEAALLERIDDQEYAEFASDDLQDLRGRVLAGRSGR